LTLADAAPTLTDDLDVARGNGVSKSTADSCTLVCAT